MSEKTYWLLGTDGQKYESATPGAIGGNAKHGVYGRLDCGSALAAIRDHGEAYTKHRVFFADEETAIAAGYRPCGNCMRDRYVEWKKAEKGTWPTVNDLTWWRGSHIAKPAENTAATDLGYEVALGLGFGEKTNVWQLPLGDGEVLRLRHPLKFFENSHEGGKAGSKISGKSSRLPAFMFNFSLKTAPK